MSTLSADPTVTAETKPTPSDGLAYGENRKPWAWMVIACLLLGVSAGFRVWQNQRFRWEGEVGVAKIPFTLTDLPRNVGRYHSEDGVDQRLDPETIRYAGGLDHLVRTYTDEETGVRLLVMVLYGRGDRVMEHIPNLCYIGAGYLQSEADLDRALTYVRPDGTEDTALFRSGVFFKPLGQVRTNREESYYAFRSRGTWGPNSPVTGHNRRPVGVFKIQVQRRLGNNELREANAPKGSELAPSEAFLTEFLGQFEAILAKAEAGEAEIADPVN